MPEPSMFDRLLANIAAALPSSSNTQVGSTPQQIYADLGNKFGGDSGGSCTMSRPERSSMNRWEEGAVNRDKITSDTQQKMDRAVVNCPKI